MNCRDCGKNIGKVRICPYCSCDNRKKSRMTAGLLQILCGAIGLGRFYLGFNKVAVWQIVATFFSFGVAGAVWGFVDGLLILSGALERDAKGNPLTD